MRLTQAGQIKRESMLLETVRENEDELPGVAPFHAALEKVHAKAVSSMSRREALAAASREATRQVNEDLAAVQDAAIALRNIIKSVLGYRNPKLALYGIKPIRKRSRRVQRHPPGCGLAG